MTASCDKSSFLFPAKVFRHEVCVKHVVQKCDFNNNYYYHKKQSYYNKDGYTNSIYSNVKHRAFLVKLGTFLVKHRTDIKKKFYK